MMKSDPTLLGLDPEVVTTIRCRGDNGLEVFVLLICYKLLYPEHFYLIRGNHESSSLTLLYGFYAECLRCVHD